MCHSCVDIVPEQAGGQASHHLEAERDGLPGEARHGARVLEAVRKVRAAARVALGLHHARPHRAPPPGRLQVEHVDRRGDRRQPHLQHAAPPTDCVQAAVVKNENRS